MAAMSTVLVTTAASMTFMFVRVAVAIVGTFVAKVVLTARVAAVVGVAIAFAPT